MSAIFLSFVTKETDTKNYNANNISLYLNAVHFKLSFCPRADTDLCNCAIFGRLAA